MDGNGLPGRMFTNMGGGMLGLEMPLHPPQHPTASQDPPKHPQIMAFTHHQQRVDQQTQLSMKQPNYAYNTNPNPNQSQKNKTQVTQLVNSDEDEPSIANDDSSFDGTRKNMSPWQRMKWTDSMVRLLIMAVYYIGDDQGGSDLVSEKKKPGGGGGGSGLLQKKGKWKSVSKALMEKGFYVSPQQCEDKFNDLNKRYKRVNDILGKGTACKVVENQGLLDTMDLSPKMKEEVRKLLNSKHLFFREMCAYHNSCGHGTGEPTTEAVAAAKTAVLETSNQPHQQQQQQQRHQHLCLHTTTSAQIPPSIVPSSNSNRFGLGIEEPKLEDHDDDDDDDAEDDDDEEDEYDDEEEEQQEEGGARKRARTQGGISSNSWQALQQLSGEIKSILQDGSKKSWEKRQWVMTQMVELEEQGVKFQYEALELEKQRLKWIKFSSKKEREMERVKIENERKRLENERMLLLLKQKEMELLDNHHQRNPSNRSCVTG